MGDRFLAEVGGCSPDVLIRMFGGAIGPCKNFTNIAQIQLGLLPDMR